MSQQAEGCRLHLYFNFPIQNGFLILASRLIAIRRAFVPGGSGPVVQIMATGQDESDSMSDPGS